MQRTYVKDIQIGNVFLQGFVHEIRDLAKIKFLLLRDMTGIVQCITKDSKLFKKFSDIGLESVVSIKGKAKKANVKFEEARKDIEIEIDSIELLSKAENTPIQVFEKDKTIKTDLSKRLDYRCLDLRKRRNFSIMKIQSKLLEGMQIYLNSNGFLQVFTPCLMGSSSEGGAEVFKLKYYEKGEAFLRQDPQLHRQLTILGGLEKIYDLGPSWRAESSHTTRHLCEHRTIAAEFAFIKDQEEVMKVQEKLVAEAIKHVINTCKEELNLLDISLKVPKLPFPRLTFKEAKKAVNSKHKDHELSTEEEKKLGEYVRKKYKANFFFIHSFPFKLKPFYVFHNKNEAGSVDLYFNNIELSSGGQREHRYAIILKNLKEKKLDPKKIEWFTQFFKWGAPSHGGFAIGIERLIHSILSLSHVKEAALFPRDPERLLP